MDALQPARLQIYSVEEKPEGAAVCIVRCVGGTARTGQRFTYVSAAHHSSGRSHMTLDRILRYEKPVDLLEPPHTAKVLLSGEGVEELAKGSIITAMACGTYDRF
ncbi:hypothetical protein [Streptomyces sp. NPDC007206]|uniref:hypothetical protein n=1 Tax=Streptomyces sp. NPDC007206 TaxID=3154317 RepID=UPI0033DD8927